MENPSSESPFQDLPEALVEEMLGEYKRLGTELSTSLEKMESTKEQTRGFLSKAGLLRRDSSILRSYSHPTTCGIDGHELEDLSQDLGRRSLVLGEGPVSLKALVLAFKISPVVLVELDAVTS
jgi:hypothetical protein